MSIVLPRRNLALCLLSTLLACGRIAPASQPDNLDNPVPTLTALTATSLSSSRMMLTWRLENLGEHTLALITQPASDPEMACQDASNTVLMSATAKRRQIFTASGLTPSTSYRFKLCIGPSTQDEELLWTGERTTQGVTPFSEPLPPCDHRVASGFYTLVELNAEVAAAAALGPGDDSTMAVCLDDGVYAKGIGRLEIPTDNFVLYAALGDDATIFATDTHSRAINIEGKQGITLYNLNVRTSGWTPLSILIVGNSSVDLLGEIRLRTTTHHHSNGITVIDSTITRIEGVEAFATHAALSLTNSQVGSIRDSHFLCGHTALYAENSHIGSITGAIIGTLGNRGHGIHLVGPSSIGGMVGVDIRRLAGGYGAGVGILVDDGGLPGAYGFVQSDAVSDVRICAIDEAPWTHALADTSDDVSYNVPLTHGSAVDGSTGAQSFPFDDALGSTAGTRANVQLGGPCTLGERVPEVEITEDLSFAEFQVLLDDVVAAGDQDDDGFVAIRLHDGIRIESATQISGNGIEFPDWNIYLYAAAGEHAVFDNRGVTYPSEDHGGIRTMRTFNSVLENVTVQTAGRSTALHVVGGNLGRVEQVTLQTSWSGRTVLVNGAVGAMRRMHITNGDSALRVGGRIAIMDRVTLQSGGGFAVYLAGAIGEMRDVTINHDSDTNSAALRVIGGGSIGSIQDSQIVLSGSRSGAIALEGRAWIGAMKGVKLRRTASSVGDAVAIRVQSADSAGAHFRSPDILNVSVCTEAGAGSLWEDGAGHLLADGAAAGPWTPPVAHVAYGATGVFGAQTFPFEGSAVALQGIELGGTCP